MTLPLPGAGRGTCWRHVRLIFFEAMVDRPRQVPPPSARLLNHFQDLGVAQDGAEAAAILKGATVDFVGVIS